MVRAKARQRIGAATDFSMYSLIFVCSDMDENTDGARRTERTVRMQEQAGEKGQVSQEARSSRDRFIVVTHSSLSLCFREYAPCH
jgi:hypothetical protein